MNIRDFCRHVMLPLLSGLYHHNPLYLVSSALALVELNAAFGASSATANPWVLLGVIAGYTLLTALTAFAIVRCGGVW